MLLISTPTTPQEIINWHPQAQQELYSQWKREIRQSNYSGVTKLIENLENSEKSDNPENFLNFLCEFNIARLLFTAELCFEYETQGEDFCFNNYLMSIKSIHKSKYIKETENKLEELRGDAAVTSGNSKRDVIHNKFAESGVSSFTEIEVKGDISTITEIGSTPNTSFPEEIRNKDLIIKHIVKLEKIPTNKEKILFLFIQTSEILPIHQKQIVDWYFWGKINNDLDFCANKYPEWFLEHSERIENHTVKAIIFMYRPNEILLWSKRAIQTMNSVGNRALKVWADNETLQNFLTGVFC